MSDLAMSGEPFWLSAYPNDGTLDYFGFRFYRQPLRYHLVRGAAANNFKNAKTLLYYAAISYAFRNEFKIKLDQNLSASEFEKWSDWYKFANYLYVVSAEVDGGQNKDQGFTGANEEYKKFFIGFSEGKINNFDIKSSFERFYPDQRLWGYLTQFWGSPLRYFRCVIDIKTCSVGEYGKDSYELLSTFTGWKCFIEILKSGLLNQVDFKSIRAILNCNNLRDDEKVLSKDIIFDKRNVTEGENDEYKKNFKILDNLRTNGLEGQLAKSCYDYSTIFTYAYLTKKDFGENDMSWKILLSSLAFEIGINRLYSKIGSEFSNGFIQINELDKYVNGLVDDWCKKNKLHGTLETVIFEWKKTHLESLHSFNLCYNEFYDHKNLDTLIDGLILGFIISQITVDNDTIKLRSYQDLTNPYHFFTPQTFFRNKKIDLNSEFKVFILNLVKRIIDEQFEFSLRRMSIGQKAKFVLIKSDFDEGYVFQVDARTFYENRGVVDMIDACLCLWKTAGII